MDSRVEHIFLEQMKGDKSFQEKDHWLSSLFGMTKYSKQEMRETWHRGIKYGIEIGLRKASLEGQWIDLNNNTLDDKNKEFLNKFYQLASEYNCAIQYHPEIGIVVVNR